jgi:hypothetical protein
MMIDASMFYLLRIDSVASSGAKQVLEIILYRLLRRFGTGMSGQCGTLDKARINPGAQTLSYATNLFILWKKEISLNETVSSFSKKHLRYIRRINLLNNRNYPNYIFSRLNNLQISFISFK